VVVPSGFQPVVEVESCNGCARCRRVCPVEAISLAPSTPAEVGDAGDADEPGAAGETAPEGRHVAVIDYQRCIGCGVCVDSCRPRSLRLERRPEQRYVPANSVEFAVRSMIERGRVADLLIDGTAGRGPAFANAVIRTIASLPPAERLLAREQIRSRFVTYALKRLQPPTYAGAKPAPTRGGE
jgi:ferredoxin